MLYILNECNFSKLADNAFLSVFSILATLELYFLQGLKFLIILNLAILNDCFILCSLHLMFFSQGVKEDIDFLNCF